jgi:hypothetical protein
MADRTCPKCSTRMEEGFIMDRAYGENRQAKWVEGEPQRSIWTGLKIPRDAQHPVVTYRCAACGYLESYAT